MAGAALKTLGRYQLERVLGKGAMGVVYEALDPKLHRKVAIKTILKSQLDEATSHEYSMRFAREAEAVARLNHPHIVQVYDFGEEADVAYIVMEFIRGKELKSFFDANETFDKKDIVRIMSELLDALAFAHENGIVHRDIKPANVMLDRHGRAKLTDFGVARLTDVDRTQAERTQAGTMVGTPAYMSPEQIQGQHIDGRTDIFSAGVVLYQFLTGQRPFTGAGAWTIAKKIIQEDPPMPSTINVALPKEFDLVISKALAKLPENRYRNARDFAHALQRVLEGKSAEDEDDATVAGRMPDVDIDIGDVGAAPAKPAPKTAEAETSQTQEVELEFWRAIKDSDDAEDFELYVQQFPKGIYKALAQRKITKLRRGLLTTGASDQSSSRIRQAEDLKAAQAEEEKLRIEEEEAVRHDAEAKAKREAEEQVKRDAEEKSRREAEDAARREAEERARPEAEAKAKREAEQQAKRDAEEKSRREADEAARREAEDAARREADERARLEAAAKAKREAEEQAKHEAEVKAKREAEEKARLEAAAKAKREAEEQAKREAEAKVKRETEEKARLEAAAKARREAEEQAKREAEETAKAKREAEERARREADAKARREAEEQAKREAEEKARREAEAKARHDAEARARKEAEDRAREETRARARTEAAEKAQRAQAPGIADAVAGMPAAAPAGKKSSMLVP
ncbi:MAG: protein kinase, partial [Pseudomonadota bacterium]